MALTFDDYQRLAYSTAGEHESNLQETINWTLGIGGEAGEIIDAVKKHAYHGHTLDLTAMNKELGDLLWYISAMCTCLGISLEDIAAANLVKLAKRYPTGFSSDASKNRKE